MSLPCSLTLIVRTTWRQSLSAPALKELGGVSAVPSLPDGVARGEYLAAANQDRLMADTATGYASSDLSRKWKRGSGRWVRDVFVWTEAPLGIAALVKVATGEEVSYTTIWKLRNGQAQNPQKRLIEALARTFSVPPAFFFDDYREQAGLPQEQVELLALVRDARISSAQLRAILELSPQARQAIADLVQATARDNARRNRSEQDDVG
jgi:transcriptional regulator with XRE-family HTH domain